MLWFNQTSEASYIRKSRLGTLGSEINLELETQNSRLGRLNLAARHPFNISLKTKKVIGGVGLDLGLGGGR